MESPHEIHSEQAQTLRMESPDETHSEQAQTLTMESPDERHSEQAQTLTMESPDERHSEQAETLTMESPHEIHIEKAQTQTMESPHESHSEQAETLIVESPHESCSEEAETLKLEKSNSSSSSSSDEDFYLFDASELVGSEPNASNSGGAQLASEVDAGRGDLMSTENPFAADDVGVTQSPLNQVMEADPHRIPSSVFERSKSTTPMEWSVASNESLFSIHVGNSSFSRDNIFPGQSGELSNLPSPSGAFMPSPAVGNSDAKSLELEDRIEHPGLTEAVNAETMKEVLRVTTEEHSNGAAQPGELGNNSASISRRSDGSTTSAKSFAFPILDEGRNASARMNPEQQLLDNQLLHQQQQSQPQASETPPNAAGTRWFPCFACCPFCC